MIHDLPNELIHLIYEYTPIYCFSCQNKISFNDINQIQIKGYYCYCSKTCFYNYFLYM